MHTWGQERTDYSAHIHADLKLGDAPGRHDWDTPLTLLLLLILLLLLTAIAGLPSHGCWQDAKECENTIRACTQ